MKAPLLSLLLLTSTALAADWPQFRGPDATGVIDDQPPGPDLKIAWQTELPGRGLSSPIIVGDRVFLTCSSGLNQRILHVICLDRQDGHRLWERTVLATGRTMSHKKTCVAAPTPCSDGRRVYALFSSNDLVAFDLDGNLQWLRGLTLDYPNASNSLGMASSPVVIADTLVVQSENDSESLALGLDAATGANRWKMSRPKAANWTSPVVLGEVVGLQSSKGLTGVHAATGEIRWDYTDGAATIPSSVVAGDVALVPSNGLTALAIEKDSTSQLWREKKLGPGTASPIVIGGWVYVISGAGVLAKADLKTGEEQWKMRLAGPFSGSPVAADHYLYIANERGDLQVVDLAGAEGKVVTTVPLEETILATPALSSGALFVRSDGHLWCLR